MLTPYVLNKLPANMKSLTGIINRVKLAYRIGILNNKQRDRNHCGFFMRKILVLHHYVELSGQSQDWPVLVPVCQPAQSGAMIGIMLSGFKYSTSVQS